MRCLKIINDGLVPYEKALNQQLEWVASKHRDPHHPDILWLLSHPPVITLGADKDAKNQMLQESDIPIHRISRGGSITYHDPGQVTGYLIFSLSESERDLRVFLKTIEETLIQTLNQLLPNGTETAYRVEGKTGVFLKGKKVCSIGTACRHWITYHGFSMNFESNLENYKLMNPCGMESGIMGNVSDLTKISRKDFLELYPSICGQKFGREVLRKAKKELEELSELKN